MLREGENNNTFRSPPLPSESNVTDTCALFSCHGGSHTGVYDFITQKGSIPYDTCVPYMACSEESSEGFCKYVDTSCNAENTCKTCDTFAGMGGKCSEIDYYPNATISEYGTYSILSAPTEIVHRLKSEIYARGPVAYVSILLWCLSLYMVHDVFAQKFFVLSSIFRNIERVSTQNLWSSTKEASSATPKFGTCL